MTMCRRKLANDPVGERRRHSRSTSSSGVVTLTGTVESDKQKASRREDWQEGSGVKCVVNEITVVRENPTK